LNRARRGPRDGLDGRLQVCRPLIEVLAENDNVPKKLDEVAAHANLRALPIAQVMQAILILAGAGHVHPAQENVRAVSGDIQFLASPVIGGGVPVPRLSEAD